VIYHSPVTPCLLLLVDDNDDDRALIVRALRKARLECTLQVAHDAEEAAFLLGISAGRAPSVALPDLVLLDVRLPRMGGFDVLEMIRRNPKTRDLDVVVLSNSADPGDAERAEELGAEYVKKLADYDGFAQVVQRAVLERLGQAAGESGNDA